jgi:hypothetical protein
MLRDVVIVDPGSTPQFRPRVEIEGATSRSDSTGNGLSSTFIDKDETFQISSDERNLEIQYTA